MRVVAQLSAHAPAIVCVQYAPLPPCSAKVTYPNGDTFEGSFNDDRQKHGHGIYTWSSAPGANPWVPPVDEDAEEDADSGFPSTC